MEFLYVTFVHLFTMYGTKHLRFILRTVKICGTFHTTNSRNYSVEKRVEVIVIIVIVIIVVIVGIDIVVIVVIVVTVVTVVIVVVIIGCRSRPRSVVHPCEQRTSVPHQHRRRKIASKCRRLVIIINQRRHLSEPVLEGLGGVDGVLIVATGELGLYEFFEGGKQQREIQSRDGL